VQAKEWPRVDKPSPPDSPPPQAQRHEWAGALAGLASVAFALEIALGLRVLAAGLVDLFVRRRGSDKLCMFPDARYYWELGRMIRSAARFEIVEWSDIPHFSIRTPGYPLFLAACQGLFGERTLPVRLVQAVLGTVSVYMVYRLTTQVIARTDPTNVVVSASGRWSAPLVAAFLAAIGPYYVSMSSLILSEAVFEPLLLVALLGLASLWDERSFPARDALSNRTSALIAFGGGAAAGAAILVRPSWALFVPVMLGIWVVTKLGDRRARAATMRGALVYTLGVAVLLGPWWFRNVQTYGRFVPTALWMGASLYDGINPMATGKSDMSFLSDPEIWPLDELDQDAELTRRASGFARTHPGRVGALAFIKLARYWSPWPNADNFRSPVLLIATAIVEIPVLGLIVLGAYRCRRELRTLVLLAGPVVYFCALHLAFASSMRYRVPGQMPALGLAAIGWITLIARVEPCANTVRS
jgi:Dolichyl-phosphate-mannose-protein mannosyltransferase